MTFNLLESASISCATITADGIIAPSFWTLPEAIDLCEKIEPIAKRFHYHTALTGGCLYGARVPRKDADILFYSERQERRPNRNKLLKALEAELGIKLATKFNWLQKAIYNGKKIDFFFPETKKLKDEEYPD